MLGQFNCGWNVRFGKVTYVDPLDSFSCREIASSRAIYPLNRIFSNFNIQIIQEFPKLFSSHSWDALSAGLKSHFVSEHEIHYVCRTYRHGYSEKRNQYAMASLLEKFPNISVSGSEQSLPFSSEGIVGVTLEGGPEVLHAFYWYHIFLAFEGSNAKASVAKATSYTGDPYIKAWEKPLPENAFQWAYCILFNQGPIRYTRNRIPEADLSKSAYSEVRDFMYDYIRWEKPNV